MLFPFCFKIKKKCIKERGSHKEVLESSFAIPSVAVIAVVMDGWDTTYKKKVKKRDAPLQSKLPGNLFRRHQPSDRVLVLLL